MTEAGRGTFAVVAACVIWGLSSIYYKALAAIPPLELLAHRTAWSVVFFAAILVVQGRFGAVVALLRGPSSRLVALAAVLISANWFMFIYAVQVGRAMEASLGYFIFPLVAVLLGIVAFGERLVPAQGVAVALTTIAVILLSWGLGAAPWISLGLAVSFGLYGLCKKRLDAGPMVSVAAEVALLAPLALIWLGGVHAGLWSEAGGSHDGQFGRDWRTSLLLACAGPITAVPLMLFAYASRRVRMATVGLAQFLNPTLQFLLAVLLFREVFTVWHALAFALIWAALALYSAELVREDRALRRARASAVASKTTPM